MVVSYKIWNRGVIATFPKKLNQLKYGWSTVQKLAFAFFILLFIGSGSLVFYNENIISDYDTLNDQLDLETNSSNLLVLDENFREMMLNGYTNKLFYSMDLGASGFFMGDNSSTSIIQLRLRETNPMGQMVADSALPVLQKVPRNSTIHNID